MKAHRNAPKFKGKKHKFDPCFCTKFGFNSTFQNVYGALNKYSLQNASDLANLSLAGLPCGAIDWAPIYDVAVKRLQCGDEQGATATNSIGNHPTKKTLW